MFQFRRFPTVHYLIHARLTEYGSAGFPHSDISGSMLICSSPKLFAAYHVLHRLLMPRHSPCALLRLTASELASVPFRFRRSLNASAENFTPLRCSSSPAQTRFAGLCAGFFWSLIKTWDQRSFRLKPAFAKVRSGFRSPLRKVQLVL